MNGQNWLVAAAAATLIIATITLICTIVAVAGQRHPAGYVPAHARRPAAGRDGIRYLDEVAGDLPPAVTS